MNSLTKHHCELSYCRAAVDFSPPPSEFSHCSNSTSLAFHLQAGDGSSLIQNTVCKRNSSTNQLTSIRRLRSTCEARGYAVLGKKELSGTSASQRAFYLAARANHTFSQSQQGVLWHLFTVESTARTYHP